MRTSIIVLAVLAPFCSSAQDWAITGNTGTTFGTHFVGTTNAVEMSLRTNDKVRLVTNQDNTYTIGSFTSRPAYGFVGISPTSYFWDNGPGPFSRLHLAEPGANGFQGIGYRPWMRNGITFTGNADQMYIGQKYTYDDPEDEDSGELTDYTDAIIQWSDNPGTWLSDRMRFIFTSEYDADPTGNGSLEGLEAMQLFPNDSGSEVFVGIGDWYGHSATPSERLDVLDRTVRIRQLVPDYEDQDLEKFVVTDDNGRLHWRNMTSAPDNCEWEQISGGAYDDDVVTALGTNPGCPDADNSVGIGTNTPAAKLDVVTDEPVDGSPGVGIHVLAKGDDDDWTSGVLVTVLPSSGYTTAYQSGVEANVSNATSNNIAMYATGNITGSVSSAANYGVNALAYSSSSGTVSNAYALNGLAENGGSGTTVSNHGVYGKAIGGTYDYGVFGISNDAAGSYNHGVFAGASNATNNYGLYAVGSSGTTSFGVYAQASGGSTNYGVYATASGGTNWAVYSSGNQFSTTGSAWTTSDAMFKQDIEPLTGALDRVMALEPSTYTYDNEAYDFMNLPEEPQFGLIAQDAAEVIPELVREVVRPADLDSLGNVVHPELAFKAMKYDGLIPILISAMQEQQAQIAQLQSDLAGCCSTERMQLPGGGNDQGISTGSTVALDRATEQLRIQPNPFGDGTTITYNLAAAGQVRLIVSTAAGKQLSVLEEGMRDSGRYTYEWNTVSMASGVYNVMLLVDGAPMVQKAIKIVR